MDQDGFSIGIFIVSMALLVSGLRTGVFRLQFVKAARKENALDYWVVFVVILLVAGEAFRRAWFIGCPDCD